MVLFIIKLKFILAFLTYFVIIDSDNIYFTWQFSQSKSIILDLLHVDFVSIGLNGIILFTYVKHLKSSIHSNSCIY